MRLDRDVMKKEITHVLTNLEWPVEEESTEIDAESLVEAMTAFPVEDDDIAIDLKIMGESAVMYEQVTHGKNTIVIECENRVRTFPLPDDKVFREVVLECSDEFAEVVSTAILPYTGKDNRRRWSLMFAKLSSANFEKLYNVVMQVQSRDSKGWVADTITTILHKLGDNINLDEESIRLIRSVIREVNDRVTGDAVVIVSSRSLEELSSLTYCGVGNVAECVNDAIGESSYPKWLKPRIAAYVLCALLDYNMASKGVEDEVKEDEEPDKDIVRKTSIKAAESA